MSEKTDEQILFPGVEVEGYKITPWKFGELIDLLPMISQIIKVIQAEQVKSLNDLSDRMGNLIPLILPFTPEIIAKTLDIDLNEIHSWPLHKATVILLTIINQNLDYLKNSFGLVKLMTTQEKES